MTAFAAPETWSLNPRGVETVIIGGEGENGAYNVRPTADGGCVIAGCISVPGKGKDLVVYKRRADLSADTSFGDQGRWSVGSTGDDQAIDVIEIKDTVGRPAGYLVVGFTATIDADFASLTARGKTDLFIARLTPAGELDTNFGQGGMRLYGGSENDQFLQHNANYSEPGHRIVQVEDGFVIAAMTVSKDGDLQDVPTVGWRQSLDGWVFKIDARGDYMTSFGTGGSFRIGNKPGPLIGRRSPHDLVWSINLDEGGGFVLGGFHYGVGLDVDGVTTRSPGNNTDNGSNASPHVHDHQMDGWMFRLDPSGQLRSDWASHGIAYVGGSRQEKLYDVIPAGDGGYLFTGRTSSYDLAFSRPPIAHRTFDMVLMKIGVDGKLDTRFGEHGLQFWGGADNDQGSRVLRRGEEIVWVGQSLRVPAELANLCPDSYARQVIVTLLTAQGKVLRRWSLGAEGDDWPFGAALDTRGRLLIAGYQDKTRSYGPAAQAKSTEKAAIGVAPKSKGDARDLLLMRIDLNDSSTLSMEPPAR